MGRLFWPSHLIICLMLSASINSHAQLVPDDIAFKTTQATKKTETIEADPATESRVISETEPIPTLAEAPAPSASQDCKINSHWQKNLTILTMPRLNPASSNAGNLYQAETQLPRLLATELNKAVGIHSNFFPFSSRQDLSGDNLRQQIRSIATQADSQFVLSGEILDMSMRDASTAYSPHFLQSLRNHFTDITMIKFADNRDRYFSLRLELRDGFTGEVLIDKHFHTSGIWKASSSTGFDSPQFWQSQYGRRIKKLLHKASNELATNIKCQPFMARIQVTPGQNEMILQGGANHGLQAGDHLKLYQMIVVASNRYETYQTRLIKRDVQLQLKEVYPSHSLAQLLGDDMMNGQYLAVGEE